VGYYLPNGKYKGDDGKVYANYNDALAQHNSLKGRRATEAALTRNARELEKTRSTQGVHQFFDNMFGGLGLDYDRGHATLAKQEAMLEAERRVLQNTLTDYQFRQGERSGLSPQEQRALIEGTDGAAARVARIKAQSDALVDAARKDPNHQHHDLFQQAAVLSNEPDARASEMERMRQQYGAGASFWNTDEGKDLLLDTMSNQYTGDQAGLPGFYQDQVKAGLGQLDMIKKGLGYEKGSAMAKWADENPALALREYNKRQPNAYSGTGPSDEEIKAAMAAGNFFASQGSPNPLGKTGEARETNTAQTEAIQPTQRQAINNESLNAIEALMDNRSHNVPQLEGYDTFLSTAKRLYGDRARAKMLRTDPYLS